MNPRLTRKMLTAAILFGAGVQAAWAQWAGGPSGPIYYNGGNVGIGTATPSQILHVIAPGSSAMQIDTSSTNNGLTSPFSQANILLKAAAGNYPGNSTAIMGLNQVGAGVAAINFINLGQSWFPNNAGGIAFATYDGLGDGGTTKMYIQPNGNVGIGTTNPIYPLSVKGAIAAGEVIVTSTTNWSDYVFQPGYRLRPLGEVKAYVEANHHLPEIPSEAEVAEKGISLAEMQAKLLAKIEELTLHLIREQERNDALERRLERLESPRERGQQGEK